MESLRSLVRDRNQFLAYTENRFLMVNEFESQRRTSVRFEKARRNARLNRYYNIVPYDSNSVELTKYGVSNYINASYIVPPMDIPKLYIATQGPLKSTIVDFWRMALEQKSQVIVCLTPHYENGIEKCARYWPVKDETLTLPYGNFTFKVLNEEAEQNNQEAQTIIRRIRVEVYQEQELKESHVVTQLHFLGWPDHGVPNETKPVIQLIKLTRQYQENLKPVIVHCSAGCGRTGTFCVIDTAEALMRLDVKVDVDPIFYLTDEFRKQRTTMVQAQKQFEFCYKALIDFIDQEE